MVAALIVLVLLGLLAFTTGPSCPAPFFHAPADRDRERERDELRSRA